MAGRTRHQHDWADAGPGTGVSMDAVRADEETQAGRRTATAERVRVVRRQTPASRYRQMGALPAVAGPAVAAGVGIEGPAPGRGVAFVCGELPRQVGPGAGSGPAAVVMPGFAGSVHAFVPAGLVLRKVGRVAVWTVVALAVVTGARPWFIPIGFFSPNHGLG